MTARRWRPDARGRALIEEPFDLRETADGWLRVRIEAFAIEEADWSEAVARPERAGSHAVGVVEEDPSGDVPVGEQVVIPVRAVRQASPLSLGVRGEDPERPSSLVESAGLWCDRVDVPRDSVWRRPTAASPPEAAAAMRALPLAWQGLHDEAALRPGEDLCVLGAASAMGTFAVQLGHRFGARVIAVVDAVEHVGPLRDLGAHDVVQTSNHNLEKEIAKLTAKRGAEVVFVAAAIEAERLQAMSAPRARVVFGAPPAVSAGLAELLSRGRRLCAARAPEHPRAARALEWMERGDLRAVVDGVFDVSESPRAVARLSDRQRLGAVVVRVDD